MWPAIVGAIDIIALKLMRPTGGQKTFGENAELLLSLFDVLLSNLEDLLKCIIS